ncbi:eCIS core domain-containing protein [Sorangium sp. So ce542]|uniref:eCIS core domain-containing protein n=1 Tax=Sorangium sp. So ce542 TaxID=3133316 RepID=UPI003F6368EF
MFSFDRKPRAPAPQPPALKSTLRRTTEGGRSSPGPAGSSGKAAVPPALPVYLRQTKDTGAPLGNDLRRGLEASFQAPLGHVRVIADEGAAHAARGLGARAFAWGTSIWLDPAEVSPSSAEGRRVLAHEVAHTLQSAGGAPEDVTIGERGDAAERDAERAAGAFLHGGKATVARHRPALRRDDGKKGAPPVAWGSGWFPSEGGPIPSVTKPPPAPQNVFEDAAAQTSAGAAAAFAAYKALSPSVRRMAFDLSYPKGNVAKCLSALKAAGGLETYPDQVAELLRWTEGYEARKESGKTDDEMAKIQSAHVKAKPNAAGPGWGGTPTTRWDATPGPEQKKWTARANAAIAKIVAHAAAKAPDLKLTSASFEIAFKEVDEVSLGAIATVGSQPGKTVQIGFEFVVLVEIDAAYALSTVAHELLGHPTYDRLGSSYQSGLYDKAKAGVANAPSGTETFEYFPSEMYSLLRELPYWTQVTPADDKTKLDPVIRGSKPSNLNYDPRGAIRGLLKRTKKAWDAKLFVPLVRGYYKRLQIDPGIKPVALQAFETIIKNDFAAESAQILK